jgi:hypothetical protein
MYSIHWLTRMKTFKEQEAEIRARIIRATYSYPADVAAAYYAWNDYAILLGRALHPWTNVADQIADGYKMRAICLRMAR